MIGIYTDWWTRSDMGTKSIGIDGVIMLTPHLWNEQRFLREETLSAAAVLSK